MYTYGGFMLRFDRKLQTSVKQLFFNKKKKILSGEISTTSDMQMILLYKEQCCTGTWNVRFMNQSKLDVVK